MKKIVLLTILGLVSITGWAADSPKWEKYSITFPTRAKVTNGVVFSYVGKNYLAQDKSKLVPLEKKEKALMDPEERFIHNIITSNASGDAGQILEMWPPSERQSVEAAMKSKEMLEKNRAFFRNIEVTRLVTVLRYDRHFLFVVEHEVKGIGKYMKLYAAISDGGSYLMTNTLHGDLFYEKVISDLLNYFNLASQSRD